MPKVGQLVGEKRLRQLRLLGAVLERLEQSHRKDLDAIGSRIPVGGAHMDDFFKAEGIRGIQSVLRRGETFQRALEQGCENAKVAILKWNERCGREYQIKRWEGSCESYLIGIMGGLKRAEDRQE